jgi:hypothetical protein
LFSLFFPFINFVSDSYYVCVILSRGRGGCREICFHGFSLFFQPWSGTVLLLNSSWLSHYTAVVLNHGRYQYGCAMYVR